MGALIEQALLGIFGGAGATLLWEMVLKPMRERRGIAEVLEHEIGRNAQALLAERAQRLTDLSGVPVRQPMRLDVYKVILPQLGALSYPLLGQLMHLYGLFATINDLANAACDYRAQLLHSSDPDASAEKVFAELDVILGEYSAVCDSAVAMIVRVQLKLYAAAFPPWSSRRWTQKQQVVITQDEMTEKSVSYIAEVEARVRDIRAHRIARAK